MAKYAELIGDITIRISVDEILEEEERKEGKLPELDEATEEYEDKVFQKIMDIHMEEESKEILRDMAENPSDEPLPPFDEFARRIGADVYSDQPNVEIDPNDITPEELFRTWAVAKGFMEIRKEPTPERIELMQKERRGEVTVEEIKLKLDEKYSKKST